MALSGQFLLFPVAVTRAAPKRTEQALERPQSVLKRPDFPRPISPRFSLKFWGLSPHLWAPAYISKQKYIIIFFKSRAPRTWIGRWTVFLLSKQIFGKGMRRSTFQWKKGFSVKRGVAIQWMRGLVRISTGKAIQWRGSGDSLNHRTLKTEKLLSSSPSQKSALNLLSPVKLCPPCVSVSSSKARSRCSAVVPQNSKVTLSAFDPSTEVGVTMPLGYWDPLGFSKDPLAWAIASGWCSASLRKCPSTASCTVLSSESANFRRIPSWEPN